MKRCNVWRIKLNPLKTRVLDFSRNRHPIMDCSIKMNNINLKAECLQNGFEFSHETLAM